MDTTIAGTQDDAVRKAFADLFTEALRTSPTSGNGWGVALAAILGMGAICIVGLVIIYRGSAKYRDRIDKQLRDDRAEDKRISSEALAKAEARAEAERERDERSAREQRDRDEAAARERARADQADREQARNNLMQHIDNIIDKLRDSFTAVFNRIDAAIGALQGKFENHDARIVSLERELEHLKTELKELKALKK